MTVYEVRDAGGQVFRMSGDDPLHACRRAADLHQTTIVAWRESRHPSDAIRVGIPEEPR